MCENSQNVRVSPPAKRAQISHASMDSCMEESFKWFNSGHALMGDSKKIYIKITISFQHFYWIRKLNDINVFENLNVVVS